MSEKIESALNERVHVRHQEHRPAVVITVESRDTPKVLAVDCWAMIDCLPELIAASNRELPDSDPRKITREKIDALRTLVRGYSGVDLDEHDYVGDTTGVLGERFIDALESYLEPSVAFSSDDTAESSAEDDGSQPVTLTGKVVSAGPDARGTIRASLTYRWHWPEEQQPDDVDILMRDHLDTRNFGRRYFIPGVGDVVGTVIGVRRTDEINDWHEFLADLNVKLRT